jgi:hypothetical protein
MHSPVNLKFNLNYFGWDIVHGFGKCNCMKSPGMQSRSDIFCTHPNRRCLPSHLK